MHLRFFATAILLIATATPPAVADTLITYTFTTVATGVDVEDVFGPHILDNRLDGLPEIFVLTVDLGKGTPVYNPNYATYLQVDPTADLSLLNVWASITINGRTVTSSDPRSGPAGNSSYGETRVNGNLVAQSFNVETYNPGPSPPITWFSYAYTPGSAGVLDFYSYSIPHEGGTDIKAAATTPVVTI